MEKKKKREIRILIDEKNYKRLKEESKRLSIPLASLVKVKLGER